MHPLVRVVQYLLPTRSEREFDLKKVPFRGGGTIEREL